ncbi:MAG TPA: flagellar export chaperone FliS [Longimicrobiales bacterium]
MIGQRNASAYLEAKILSSSREELIPLLYEHLCANLRRAAAQIEAGDIEGKAASLDRASGIIFELLASLDFEAGGDLASRLAALYSFFAREIAEASRTLDRPRLERVIGMVESLHGAWQQAAAQTASRSRDAGRRVGG